MIKHMLLLTFILGLLLAGKLFANNPQTKTFNLTPSAPTDSWSATLGPGQSASLTVTIASSGTVGNDTYNLATSDFPTASGFWTGPHGTGLTRTYNGTNPDGTTGADSVTVTCRWDPVLPTTMVGTNSGPIPNLPTPIHGSGTATLNGSPVSITWEIDPNSRFKKADGEDTYEYTATARDAQENLVTVTFTSVTPDNATPSSPGWTISGGSGENSATSGTVKSSTGSLGNLKVSYTYGGQNYTHTSTEELIFVKLKIQRIWSGQTEDLSNVYYLDKSGGISTGANGYNWILMACKNDNIGYAKVKLIDYNNNPQSVRNKIKINYAKIESGNLNFNPLGNSSINGDTATISINNPNSDNEYYVIAWLDSNSDNQYDSSELIDTAAAYHFRIVNQLEYNTSKTLATGGSLIASSYSTASGFLLAFATGNNPSIPFSTPEPSSTIIYNNDTRLSHLIGANFNQNGQAPIIDYYYNNDTDISGLVAYDLDMRNTIKDILDSKKSMVKQYFINNPTTYQNEWVWALPQNINFTQNLNLYLAFGTADLNASIRVIVKREDLSVVELELNGIIRDLYDWDYYGGGTPDRHASKIQAGYNTLGLGGKIFITTVRFDKAINFSTYKFE